MDSIEKKNLTKNVHLIKTAISLIEVSSQNEDFDDVAKNINLLEHFLGEIKSSVNYSEIEKKESEQRRNFVQSLHSKISELESMLAKKNDIQSSSITFKNYCDEFKDSLNLLGFTRLTMNSHGFLDVELSIYIPKKYNSNMAKNEEEVNKKQKELDDRISNLKKIFDFEDDNFNDISIVYSEKNKEKLINLIKSKTDLKIINFNFTLKNFETRFIDKIYFTIQTSINQYENLFRV